VGTTAGISFGRFFVVAAPYVTVAPIITIVLGARQFGIRRLGADERDHAAEQVEGFDENDGQSSREFFIFGAVMTVLFIAVIATTSVLPWVSELGMGFVALMFATLMLWRYKNEVDQFYRTVDWDLLGFFIALFIVINVMEHAQVLNAIGGALEHVINLGATVGSGAMLVAAAVFSSVTDNIPLAAMLAKILSSLGTDPQSPMWWAVIFGANLGGNITPIGSASTLVAMTIIHKNKLDLSFAGFVKVAALYAVVQITVAVAYVVAFLS